MCYTQWTETRAVFNRGQYKVAEQVAEIGAALSLAILGFDTDNGGASLNWHLVNSFARRRRPISSYQLAGIPSKRQRAHRAEEVGPTCVSWWATQG